MRRKCRRRAEKRGREARFQHMGTRTRLLLAALVAAVAAAPATANASSCDPIDTAACLLPWPNDYFTKPDATTATGKRLDLDLTEMPKDAAGVPIDPTAQNRNDGFSPGSLIITRVPGLDTPAAFASNDFPTNVDPSRSFAP